MSPPKTHDKAALLDASGTCTFGTREQEGRIRIIIGVMGNSSLAIVGYVSQQSECGTLRRGRSPTWYAFHAQIGPRQFEFSISMCSHHGFGHLPFLPQYRLSDKVCDTIVPYWHTVQARHGMVDSQCSKPCAICMGGSEELCVELHPASFDDESHDALEEI